MFYIVLRQKLDKYERQAAEISSRPIKFMIVDMSPVAHIDSAGLHVLDELASFYESRAITFILSNPSRVVMEKLVLSRLVDEIGRGNFFVSVHDAVNSCLHTFGEEEIATTGSQGDASDDFVVDDHKDASVTIAPVSVGDD